MFGFISLYKANKYQFFVLLIILLLHLYVASCWRVWHFTSKFSIRVFIDFYAVVGLLLLFLLKDIKTKSILKYIFYPLIVLLILLNLFQAYQQRIWVFPLEFVSKDIYWDSFTRTVPVARASIDEEHVVGRKTIFNDFEKNLGWENESSLTDIDGNNVTQICDNSLFSVGFKDNFQKYFSTEKRVIKISADIFSNKKQSSGLLVVEFLANDINYSYNPLYLKSYNRQDKWVPVEFAFYVPKPFTSDDMVKIYFYNDREDEILMADNLMIEFISFADDTEYIEHIKTPKNNQIKRVNISNTFEKELGWPNEHTLTNEFFSGGSNSCKINKKQPYSAAFEHNIDTLISPGRTYIKVNASILTEKPLTETRLIFEIFNNGNSYGYFPYYIQEKVISGKWSTIEYFHAVKEIQSQSDIIKIYFWNPSESEIVFIDDLNIEFITIMDE